MTGFLAAADFIGGAVPAGGHRLANSHKGLRDIGMSGVILQAPADPTRKLSEIITLWYKLHGCSLGDKKGRLGKLHIICRGLNDPIASAITAKDWAHYRERRLSGLIENSYKTSEKSLKVSVGTVNREHCF